MLKKITAVVLIFSSFNFFAGANECSAEVDHLVINEIAIDSVVGSGGTDDDWVELYNPTAENIFLDGWSIQKTSSSGGSPYKQALSGSVAAGGYFLIVRNGSSTAQDLKDKADLLANNSFSLSSGNIVYLVNDSSNITDSFDANIVDFVGFGSASFYEGASAALAIAEAKSITRSPEGNDTNQNGADFIINDNPTPQGASATDENAVGGTVLLTITPNANPVQNINSTGADIVFQANADGRAIIKYGADSNYGNATLEENIVKSADKTISLVGMQCNTTYHYAIYAENSADTENDQTADAEFTTLPCGMKIDSLTMTKSSAKANNSYSDGWTWEFNITVWDKNETSLKMKFDRWSGSAGNIDAGANMQYSADNGANWTSIAANGAYPAGAINIGSIDNSADSGRQVKILVKMKVPAGAVAGYYNSSYGILAE